jgi:large subunit ribosomal protein L17
VADLIKYNKIVTTEAKAKEIRGLAEKMITLGKEGSLASRRRALAFVTDEKLIDRIIKLGQRVGDAARQAQVEMVE